MPAAARRSSLRWLTLICVFQAGVGCAQWMGPERDNAENLSVMIDVNYKDVPTAWGTGIIVSRSQNTLYIATAKHVVNRGSIHDIQVSFRWKNPKLGKAYAVPMTMAGLLAAPLPPDPLDLAVLKVVLDAENAPPDDTLHFEVLADPTEVKPSLGVRPLGHAN